MKTGAPEVGELLGYIRFNHVMVTCYRRTPPVLIRTFDGIHLATARVAGETEIVAMDNRLREAAKLLGFDE